MIIVVFDGNMNVTPRQISSPTQLISTSSADGGIFGIVLAHGKDELQFIVYLALITIMLGITMANNVVKEGRLMLRVTRANDFED